MNLRRVAAVLLLVFALVCERFGWFALRPGLVRLMTELGVAPSAASANLRLMTHASYGVAVLTGVFALFTGARPLAIATSLAWIAGAIALPLVGADALWLPLALLAVGGGGFKIALFGVAAELTAGAEALAAFTGFYVASNAGALAATTAGGFVASLAGLRAVCVLAAAAAAAGLICALVAIVVARPRVKDEGPARGPGGVPVALAWFAAALPTTLLLYLLYEAQAALVGGWDRAGMLLTLNPLVVIGTGALMTVALVVLASERREVLAAWLCAAGALLLVVSALPFFLDVGTPAVRAVASTIIGAVGEVLFMGPAQSRVCTAVPVRGAALAAGLWSVVLYVAEPIAQGLQAAASLPSCVGVTAGLTLIVAVLFIVGGTRLERRLSSDGSSGAPNAQG